MRCPLEAPIRDFWVPRWLLVFLFLLCIDRNDKFRHPVIFNPRFGNFGFFHHLSVDFIGKDFLGIGVYLKSWFWLSTFSFFIKRALWGMWITPALFGRGTCQRITISVGGPLEIAIRSFLVKLLGLALVLPVFVFWTQSQLPVLTLEFLLPLELRFFIFSYFLVNFGLISIQIRNWMFSRIIHNILLIQITSPWARKRALTLNWLARRHLLLLWPLLPRTTPLGSFSGFLDHFKNWIIKRATIFNSLMI